MRFFATILAVAAFAYTAPQCSAQVFDLTAIISETQENPAPTGVPASAAGLASIQFHDATNELSWNIAWQDLTGPAVGMHFHAPAASGSNAGVVVNIGDISGLTSPSVGSTVIDDTVAGQILSDQSYINIHTAQNGPGEIRGQVSGQNVSLTANLNTAQEIPPPVGASDDAGGSASVVYDPATSTLGWSIAWQDLTGPATGMHFHGPAGPGENASVRLNIGDLSGLTSPSIGTAVIDADMANELLGGQWYINIHTEQNGPGEIRGQVVPEPAAGLLGFVALLALHRFRRRSSVVKTML